MREWTEELSEWIESREKGNSGLEELCEEIHQASLETEFLIQASERIELALSSIVEKNATPL
jgi:hypothetical protein